MKFRVFNKLTKKYIEEDSVGLTTNGDIIIVDNKGNITRTCEEGGHYKIEYYYESKEKEILSRIENLEAQVSSISQLMPLIGGISL